MEITRRNRSNNVSSAANRGINLATWGPLINRFTKMAIEYAQSGKGANSGTTGVTSPLVSTQYSVARTRRRGTSRKRDGPGTNTAGIPRVVNVKIHYVTMSGAHMLQANNGSQSAKWHLDNLSEPAKSFLGTNSIPANELSFLKAFGCWKYLSVSVKFEPCLSLADGGYHAAVAQSQIVFAEPTPSVIRGLEGGQLRSVRNNISLTLVPTHNDGVVHYGESMETEQDDKLTGTIMYYIAGGPISGSQPIAVATFVVKMALWNN